MNFMETSHLELCGPRSLVLWLLSANGSLSLFPSSEVGNFSHAGWPSTVFSIAECHCMSFYCYAHFVEQQYSVVPEISSFMFIITRIALCLGSISRSRLKSDIAWLLIVSVTASRGKVSTIQMLQLWRESYHNSQEPRNIIKAHCITNLTQEIYWERQGSGCLFSGKE